MRKRVTADNQESLVTESSAIKKWLYAIAFVVIAIGGAAFWHLHGDESHALHGDASHAHHTARLTLDEGRKWATDEALRTGMQSIRDMTAAAAAAAHGGVDAAQAAQLGAGVEGRVNDLIAHCRLAPGADAVLHVLIGDLLRGASLMKTEAGATEGLAVMLNALDHYPRYFDHAGWVPVGAER